MSYKIKPTESFSLKHEPETGDELYIEDVSVDYAQDSPDGEDMQVLKVFTENNGVARFLNISTEKFSFAEIDDLIEILQDFKKRAAL